MTSVRKRLLFIEKGMLLGRHKEWFASGLKNIVTPHDLILNLLTDIPDQCSCRSNNIHVSLNEMFKKYQMEKPCVIAIGENTAVTNTLVQALNAFNS